MKVLLFFACLGISFVGVSQEKALVSSNGLSSKSGNYIFTYSVGEPVVGCVRGSDYLISQGFIPIISTIYHTSVEKNIDVLKVFPNPATDHFTVSGLDISKGYVLSIIDMQGNLILRKKVIKSSVILLPFHRVAI